MSTFPAIVPSTRATVLPTKPVSNYAATTGRGRRIRHGNIEVGQQLVLTFENITEAEMLTIRAHYLAHHQLRIPFNLSAEAKVGETAGVLDAAGYAWIYAGPIDEGDTQCDVHSVTVPLERVPEAALTGWSIQGQPVVFVTTGQRAELRYSPKLAGAAAAFTTTGQAALLLHSKRINAVAGAFVTTGQFAQLVYSGAWAPSALTPTAWHDAGTPGDFTLVSGLVSQWNDRSGNANHMTQATAGARPAYGTTMQAGLNLVTFDGAADFLGGAILSDLITASAFTILAVFRQRATPEGDPGNSWWNGAVLADEFANVGLFTRAPTGTASIQAVGYNWDGDDDGVSVTIGADDVWSVVVLTHGGGNLNAYRNGGSAVTTASGDTEDLTGAITFGWNAFADVFVEMDLAEVVILNSEASTLNRQKLEGYAAHRWGLAGNLPGGHPYKAAPP